MSVYQFDEHKKRRDEEREKAEKEARKNAPSSSKTTLKFIAFGIGLVILVICSMRPPGSLQFSAPQAPATINE